MDKDKALKLALGKIKSARDCPFSAIDALLFEAEGILEQALASQPAPVQEPVAWDVFNGICHHSTHGTESSAKAMAAEMQKNHDLSGSIAAFNVKPRISTPPAAQRPWVGLTQDELDAMFSNTIKGKKLVKWVARAIEAKLKEKNNG